MARYILIDNHSGYILGDTADLPREPISTSNGYPMTQSDMSGPIDAARWLDETVVWGFGRERRYEETTRSGLASNETGYHVYRADINGSEAVPLVSDGQDPETIAAVVRDCDYVTTIRCTSPEEETEIARELGYDDMAP